MSQEFKIADRLRELAAANTKNSEILTAIARNPNTPPDILVKLARDYLKEIGENPALELFLIENPNFIEDIYYEHFSGYSHVYENWDTYSLQNSYLLYLADWFLKLGLTHSNCEIRSLVAGNINTPEEYLEQLAEDESYLVIEALASNPSTPVEILERLAKDEESGIREIVAGNKNTPIFVLEELVKDEDCGVRETAENTIAEIEES